MAQLAVTEKKKKKPPTFHYLPKSRAHRLKKSWVEDHKIRSKWKTQKRREGLTSGTSQTLVPVEDTTNHPQIETNAGSESHVSPDQQDKSPAPSHDKQSLRDLRRIAYASKPLSTQEANPSRPKRAPGHTHNNNRGGKRETGQPNMKLRMNVLLEKIKRDLS